MMKEQRGRVSQHLVDHSFLHQSLSDVFPQSPQCSLLEIEGERVRGREGEREGHREREGQREREGGK